MGYKDLLVGEQPLPVKCKMKNIIAIPIAILSVVCQRVFSTNLSQQKQVRCKCHRPQPESPSWKPDYCSAHTKYFSNPNYLNEFIKNQVSSIGELGQINGVYEVKIANYDTLNGLQSNPVWSLFSELKSLYFSEIVVNSRSFINLLNALPSSLTNLEFYNPKLSDSNACDDECTDLNDKFTQLTSLSIDPFYDFPNCKMFEPLFTIKSLKMIAVKGIETLKAFLHSSNPSSSNVEMLFLTNCEMDSLNESDIGALKQFPKLKFIKLFVSYLVDSVDLFFEFVFNSKIPLTIELERSLKVAPFVNFACNKFSENNFLSFLGGYLVKRKEEVEIRIWWNSWEGLNVAFVMASDDKVGLKRQITFTFTRSKESYFSRETYDFNSFALAIDQFLIVFPLTKDSYQYFCSAHYDLFKKGKFTIMVEEVDIADGRDCLPVDRTCSNEEILKQYKKHFDQTFFRYLEKIADSSFISIIPNQQDTSDRANEGLIYMDQ